MQKRAALVLLTALLAQTALCCTIVSCARNGKVLVAGNEDDYTNTLYPRIWFNPRTTERFGTICFGLGDTQAQTIVNEYGLCVDFTAQNGIDPAKYNLKHPFNGDLFFTILGKCKNVPEAMAFLRDHDFNGPSQALLADAEGHSVIINAGAKVDKTGPYQINTNFNISDLATGGFDRRYELANQMLAAQTDVSVADLRQVLDHTHQEGDLTTIYSYIVDENKGLLYVYFFHNFDQPYTIDIKKALTKGYRMENLADLFPPSFAYETAIAHERSQKEHILAQIGHSGLDPTIDHYLPLLDHPGANDSTVKGDLLEVGLQLLKDAWTAHEGGGMWEYWFSMPGGYRIVHFHDARLDGAKRIFTAIQPRMKDPKMQHFIAEIMAYVELVQDHTTTARSLYETASASPTDTYPVSYDRSKAMLQQLDQAGR